MNLISTTLLGLRLFLSQFLMLVDQTNCRKSLFGVFSWYLKLPISAWRVFGIVWNVRWNSTNLISTTLSGLRLFLSQFSNLVDQTNYRKRFFVVFSLYLELPMSERCVLGVFGNIRGNITNLISTNVSILKLFLGQFSKLVDRTDRKRHALW